MRTYSEDKVVEAIVEDTDYDYATVQNIITSFKAFTFDKITYENKNVQLTDFGTFKPDKKIGMKFYTNKKLTEEINNAKEE